MKRVNSANGIAAGWMVPRVYHITGDYDFVVPAYTKDNRARAELEEEFASLEIDGPVETVPGYLDGGGKYQGDENRLGQVETDRSPSPLHERYRAEYLLAGG